MSKIVKAGKVILGQNKYSLAPEISPPLEVAEKGYVIGAVENHVAGESINYASRVEELKVQGQKIIEEADEESRQRIERANADAEQIINKAYDDAQRILEDSKAQGYKEGFEIGMNESHERMQESILEAVEFKREIMDRYNGMLVDVKSQIIGLVIDITKKVLNKEMDESEDYVESIVNMAVQNCTHTINVVLRVAPVDFGAALAIKDRIVAKFEKIEDIEIKQDSSLSRGSCVIDTSSGSIDSSIDKQLDMVLELFNDMLGSE